VQFLLQFEAPEAPELVEAEAPEAVEEAPAAEEPAHETPKIVSLDQFRKK
jgi:hypothetical protein